MRVTIKQFFYLLDPYARKALPFLILAFLISSVLDVIGVGLIGVFLGLFTNPDLFFIKYSFIKILPEKKLIVFSGILIIIAFVVKTIIALFIQKRIITFCQLLSVRLKNRMMEAYLYAPYTYHLEKNSSYLIARIQDNISNYVGSMLLPILNLVSNGLVAASILVFLAILHPILTVFLIFLFVLVALTFDFVVRKKLAYAGKIVALSNGEMMKHIHDGLHGLTEIRVLGREKYFLNSLNKVSTLFAHAAGVIVALQQIPRFLIENMIAIFIIGLSLGGVFLGYDKGLIFALVGIFAASGARLLPTITQIMASMNQMRGSYFHMNLVYNELKELDTISHDHVSLQLHQNFGEEKLKFATITLKDACFAYPNNTHAALTKINFHMERGQSIGLIGPSGAGKSTLIKLLLGFLTPQQGHLLIDNQPISNLRLWLNNFAYIPQSIYLLDSSLRHNIALGIDEECIDESRILNAINMAQLADVVKNLPNGIHTIIGENGVRLSGGQRQRVALARAFYHERDVIIMDEATSSLDYETEKEVIHTIKRLKGNRTLIVIAHRLSTVEHCDVLYKIDKGQIVTIGSFAEVVGNAS